MDHLAPRHNHLFFTRRFLPIFLVQFLGALTDNLFRNAVFVLVTFRLADEQHLNAPVMISLGAGLFILPFFLVSATAGQLADRYEKTQVIRILKFIELFLVALSGLVLMSENIMFVMGALFLLGLQSAFFGPVKYSILPQLAGPHELVAANAFVEGGTFLAVLIGTLVGGLVVILPSGCLMVASLMGGLSLLAWLITFAVPRTVPSDPRLRIDWWFLRATWPVLRASMTDREQRAAIIGLSWFWFLGAVVLSMLPQFVKQVIGGGPHLVTFLLALFSIGIGIGSLICNRVMRGSTDTHLVPYAALLMGLFVLGICGLSRALVAPSHAMTPFQFLHAPYDLLMALVFFLVAVMGGLFTVPLYSFLQAQKDGSTRSRVIAANNIVNALFMVVSSAYTMAIVKLGGDVIVIFSGLGAVSLGTAFYLKGFSRPSDKI